MLHVHSQFTVQGIENELIINNFKVPVTSVNATFDLDKLVVQTSSEGG